MLIAFYILQLLALSAMYKIDYEKKNLNFFKFGLMLFHTYMLCYIQVIIINNLIIADDDIYVHAGQIKLSLSISTNVERFFYQTG